MTTHDEALCQDCLVTRNGRLAGCHPLSNLGQLEGEESLTERQGVSQRGNPRVGRGQIPSVPIPADDSCLWLQPHSGRAPSGSAS